jgi:hypothetical protein
MCEHIQGSVAEKDAMWSSWVTAIAAFGAEFAKRNMRIIKN